MDEQSAISPEGSALRPRQLLRAAALGATGLALWLILRALLKPPGQRKIGALVSVATFVAANAVPLLLSLKLERHAPALRFAAFFGVLVDVLMILVMAAYALLTADQGATALRVRAIGSSIGAGAVCLLALLFRAPPLGGDTTPVR